ncbi:MAG: hypothetical protein GVY07_13800 [Bacteroidetes bacterium]|jgi:hypothetical protein|nr:hypothetical protein [Bacteroidota bacterium]
MITYQGPSGGSGHSGPFDGIGLSVSSTDTGGPSTTVLIDEIKIGYTWNDVVLQAPDSELVPDVSIEQAIVLRWQSQTDKSYQVQYSYDMDTWFDLGSVVSGNNQIKELFDAIDQDAKKFYRIEVK